MIYNLLVMVYGACVLVYGIFLSASFANVKFYRKNILELLGISALSGILQIIIAAIDSFDSIWLLYPLVAHLPIILFLCFACHKRFATAIASVCTAYLCCQPSKWFGLLAEIVTHSEYINYIVRIIFLAAIFPFIYIVISPVIAQLFSKDKRSIYLFNIAPLVYYIYDYVAVVYTDIATNHSVIVTEFMPFFLLVVYILLCMLYHRESQQKAIAERKEHIISITLEEQKKELEAIKNSELEIRLLRHDMRLLLNNLSVCIDNDDKATAKKMISSYVDSIDATAVKKFCNNATLNYIISAFAKKSAEHQIKFNTSIEIDQISCDEIMLSSIISNALDNAINAQLQLPVPQRKISLMIKSQNNKLLMSVKNHFGNKPVFSAGVPVSSQKGHGYGTQSILYLTERMGGNCQFTIDEDNFILRVVI